MTAHGDPNFAADQYQRAKAHWRGTTVPRQRGRQEREGTANSRPFGDGRDPLSLGQILSGTTTDLGWRREMEQGRVISEWADFIGSPAAEHTQITEFRDGLLLVQCDSSAWTTELRRLRGEILTRLGVEYPEAGIEDIRFAPPGAPSWRYGARTVPGRGPRDTYG